MIANMSKASALVDVSKKRVNPFKELWTNKFLYLLALPRSFTLSSFLI